MRARVRNGFIGLGVLLIASAGFALPRVDDFGAGGRQYVQFEPLITPVYIGGEAAGLVGVRVALAVDSRRERRALEAMRPRLTDAYLHALSEHARLYLDPAQAIDLPALQGALERAARAAGADTGELLLLETMAYAR